MSTAHFTPDLFRFLRELKENNNREWFQANKVRYQEVVQEPLLAFISDFGPLLKEINPHFVADPRKSGGSMFRIYRDVRFARDKSPYKTAASAHFRHQEGKNVHCPGFYVHLEPDDVFAGAGIWHPDGPTLLKIRRTIVDDPEAWKGAIHDESFAAVHTLEGDTLKRAPKGFEPDHPLIVDLKRKDFCSSIELDEEAVCEAGFIERFAQACRAATPFMGFLCRAVDVAW